MFHSLMALLLVALFQYVPGENKFTNNKFIGLKGGTVMNIYERVFILPPATIRSLVVALSKHELFIYDPLFLDEMCIRLSLHNRTSLSEGLFLSAWKLGHISVYWDSLGGCILYPELSFPLRFTLSLSTLILQDFCKI